MASLLSPSVLGLLILEVGPVGSTVPFVVEFDAHPCVRIVKVAGCHVAHPDERGLDVALVLRLNI